MKMWNKIKKDAEAISPVVATLMLVLVAVASVSAFYIWQSSWQKEITDNIGDTGVQTSLTIGGSSTVYEFSVRAADSYMAANPNYKISVSSSGSGVGVIAVGTGALDIAGSSEFLTAEQKAAYPDLNKDGQKDVGRELVETIIAWDAVVIVVPTANTHGLVSMNETVLRCIYYVNGGVTSLPPDVTAALAWMPHNDGRYQWNEIPSVVNQNPTITQRCTGTQDVRIFDRSVLSGTEEVFAKQMLDCGKKTVEEVNIVTGNSYATNQELIAALSANPDAVGFTSWGEAKAANLKVIPFQGDGDSAAVTPSVQTIMKDKTYDGARPLVYVTIGQPTGASKSFIEFCLNDVNNLNIAAAAGYISLYSS